MRGRVVVDYSNNDGQASFGRGNSRFEIRWSRASGDSIHAYANPPSVAAIALAVEAHSITDVRDAERFDYSSRTRSPREGQVLLARSAQGIYAAIHVRDIKAIGHGDLVDEVTFEFVILENGGRNFSALTDMPVVDDSFSRRVLFLGAGFSRNWGGLIASELAGRLMTYPAVAVRPRLRSLLISEPSFEDALEKTRTGLFEAEDAAAMEAAIRSAFDEMDEAFRNPQAPVLGATLNDFIGRFCPGPVGIGTGYVFSLNQDLLLERIYGTMPTRQQFSIPGITWTTQPHPFPAGMWPIPNASPVDPVLGEPRLLRQFNLVKLHGSMNWRSDDGSAAIVMGRRKPLTIAKWPLIEWYHRAFEQVLAAGAVRLMAIGYGWGDEHINDPIADAVRDNGLQIYSWNPLHPRDMLAGRHRGDEILQGIMGFFQRPVTEVMPLTPSSPGSADYNAIVRAFF